MRAGRSLMGGLPTAAMPDARLRLCEAWAFRLWCAYQPTLCSMTKTDRVDYQRRLLNNRIHDDDLR